MSNLKHILTIKTTRNELLSSTDKCMIEDFEISGYPINEEQKAEIKAYRKALKDLPESLDESSDANTIEWPEAPLWFKG